MINTCLLCLSTHDIVFVCCVKIWCWKDATRNHTIIGCSEAAIQRFSVEKVFWKYAANLQESAHAEVQFQEKWIAIRASAWVFSYKFVAYFQNTFSQEHLWMGASGYRNVLNNWIITEDILYFTERSSPLSKWLDLFMIGMRGKKQTYISLKLTIAKVSNISLINLLQKYSQG